MVGKFVYHRKFGKGQITKMIGNHNYYIEFESQKKEMIFPYDSFTDEYFIFDETELEAKEAE
jgi:hypothetical protein